MQNKSFDRNDSKTEIDEEQLRTLWCGGISDKVDEEILYELFLNAGPLEKVTIPKDKETKRQKNFAFIVFQHAESTQYAFDLLNGTELFRQPIRLQNKETGLGMGMGPPQHQYNNRDRDFRESRDRDRGHQRSFSTPAGGVQFGFQQQPPQHFQGHPPVWNNGYQHQQQQGYNQYQPPYGYNNMGGGQGMQNGGQYYNEGGRRDDRSYSRDRDNRGYNRDNRDDRRDYSRDRDRDRSYDRNRSRR